MEFIFKPLRTFLNNRKQDKNRSSNKIHCWDLANFGFQVPKAVALLYSTMFSFLSTVLGKSFEMPEWGLTYMELQKVDHKNNKCENFVFYFASHMLHYVSHYITDYCKPLLLYTKGQKPLRL